MTICNEIQNRCFQASFSRKQEMKKLILNFIFLCIAIITLLNVLFTSMKSERSSHKVIEKGSMPTPEIKPLMVKDEQILVTHKNVPAINCALKIQLPNIEDQVIGDNNIFFMETAPKEDLTPRVACALESASRNSELHIIMVRASPTLDLTDNTTCQIYSRYIKA